MTEAWTLLVEKEREEVRELTEHAAKQLQQKERKAKEAAGVMRGTETDVLLTYTNPRSDLRDWSLM